MADYRDDLEIDVKDLFRSLLRQWKLLLAVAILGAVLGGLYGVNNYNEARNASSTSTMSDVEMLRTRLNPKERADVEMAFRAYMQCNELFDVLDLKSRDEYIDARVELVKATQQLIAINTNFSQNQKQYYEALVEKAVSRTNDYVMQTMADEQSSASFSYNAVVKNVAIGMLTAVIIAIVVLAVKYIMSPILKTEDDIRNAFKLPVLGTIDSVSNTGTSLVYSSIYACAKNVGADTLFFGASNEDAVAKEMRSAISKLFDRKGITVIAEGNMLTEPAVIDALSSSSAVVLFERIGKSVYEDMSRSIEICQNCGVPIIGTVIIK